MVKRCRSFEPRIYPRARPGSSWISSGTCELPMPTRLAAPQSWHAQPLAHAHAGSLPQPQEMRIRLPEELGNESEHAIAEQKGRSHLPRLRGLPAYHHSSTKSSIPSSKNWYSVRGAAGNGPPSRNSMAHGKDGSATWPRQLAVDEVTHPAGCQAGAGTQGATKSATCQKGLLRDTGNQTMDAITPSMPP